MEEKNDFSDLILDDQSSGNKAKKLLLNTIVVVIVVLIAMIGFKIFSSENTIAERENATATFVPANNAIASNDNVETNIIMQEDEAKEDNFDSFKMDIDGSSDVDSKINTTKTDLKKENNTTALALANDVKKPEPSKPVQVTKPVQTPSKPKQDPFDIVTTAKPTTPKKSSNIYDVPKGSYVQILAGKKLDLSSKEVKNIKAQGFDFVVYKDPKTGIEKLLVGPYTGESLKIKLDEVRQSVKKDAFIFHLK